MSTSLDRLRTAIADRYEIERELGHGAMATVFLARDLKHDRQVAVKVMRDDVGFAMGAERFKREIELVTHLSHPHILPIYDSGEVNGELFYVMPYIEGESLRAKLNRERQLSVDDALRITCEVASALDHSHRHGIIHRDIKPENILLEDGQALVADFGIARAASAMGKEKLTSTGVSLGTPTYMSPEQGMADPGVDGRSDIYSLGCVLYEMLAGTPPFTGRTTQAVIARHSLDEVPSLSIVRSSIPEEVEDAVLRALEKVPADRFATGAEFATALQACQQSGMHSIRRTGHRTRQKQGPARMNWRAIGIAAGFALLAIAALAWRGKALFGSARPAVDSGALAGFSQKRIAVLYFQDATGNKNLGYLADGLTESLIDQLAQVNALDVVSASGVKQFRGANVSRDSIARTLTAGTLVQGKVESEGDRVRVTYTLIDGNSGSDRDEGSVVEALGNPLALQTKLAEQIALKLRDWVGTEIHLRELRNGTRNPNAWSLVQRAERMRKDADALDLAGKPADAVSQLVMADTLLAHAESLDPQWTEPIVQRGVLAARQERLTEDPAAAAAWIDAGIAHATRALAIDPRNADALELRGQLRVRPIVRGFVQDQRKMDDLINESEKDLRAAVASNPTQAGALNTLSAIQYQRQDAFESHNLAQRAYEADAFVTAAPEILWRLYVTSYDLGSFTNASTWCDEETRRFPQHFLSARCRLWLMTAYGKPDPAEAWRRAAEYERVVPPQQREYYRKEGEIVVAAVLARAKMPDSARRVLVRARADRTIDPRGELVGYEAFVRTMLGDRKEAVDMLQQYLSEHPEHRRGFAKARAWWWRDLRSDPRFNSLIAVGS